MLENRSKNYMYIRYTYILSVPLSQLCSYKLSHRMEPEFDQDATETWLVMWKAVM